MVCQPVGLIEPIDPLFSVGINSFDILAETVVHLPRWSKSPYSSYALVVISSLVKFGSLLFITT